MKNPLIVLRDKLTPLVVAALPFTAAAPLANADTYTWGRFDSGGGGYFIGMSFSQSTPGLAYVRSDVCAPHRLAAGSDTWEYTGASMWPEKASGKMGTPYGFGGTTGSAVHPANGQIIFAAFGEAIGNYDGTEGLYRSTDGGGNWSQMLSVFTYGNSREQYDGQRKMGNPVEIDRQNPAVVYFGTQKNGLYRSLTNGDSGSFVKIASIPNGAGVGTKSVVVDRFSALSSGRSSVVYASVYNDGIYRSTNGGDSFTKLTGSPKCAQWMVLGPNGNLYVTNLNDGGLGSVGGIFRFNGTNWTTITPASNPNGTFVGIDVNPLNGSQILAVANNNQIFKSSDNGASWTAPAGTTMTQAGDLNFTSQGGKVRTLLQAASAIHFDPHNNGTVYACDAFMVWKSTNVFGTGTMSWEPLYKGLNNSIPFSMIAPPQAGSGTVAMLYAGGADTSQFRYDTLGGKPASFIGSLNGYQQYFNGLDFCENQPDHIWAVGKASYGADTKIGRATTGALNSGTAWSVSIPFGAGVQTYGTRIAVSATNSLNAVITPGNNLVGKFTTNGGSSWANCTGLPGGVMPVANVYDTNHPLEADKKNGSKFYVYHHRNSGEFYRSTDGGANWSLVNTAIPARAPGEGGPYPVRVAASPSTEGDVWVALGENGLHRSTDSGTTFTQVTYFNRVSHIDFGANAPGNPNATLFVHGKNAAGQWGIYRTTDNGASWLLITPANEPYSKPIVMEGDRKVYGRLFLSDYGTGISYGAIASSSQVATPTFNPAAGTYPSAQTVTISTTTSGATIRYTTNGTAPTPTSGTVYSSPVAISATTTLKAIAYKSGSTDSTVASAIYTIGAGATEVIVDNLNATQNPSSSWTASTAVGGHYATNYYHDGNTGKGKTLTFTPTLVSGVYEIYARWNSDPTRATNVPFTINHRNGTSPVTVNQQVASGTWARLGGTATYEFNAGTAGNVVIATTGTSGYVIGDAVRWVKVGELPGGSSNAILDDAFTDGGRTNGTDALDSQWYFLANATPTSAGVTGGELLLGTTSAAVVGTNPHAVTTFPSETLATGETLTLSFNFKSTGAASATGIRFGLYNSGGTNLTGDIYSNPPTTGTVFQNDLGYSVFAPHQGTQAITLYSRPANSTANTVQLAAAANTTVINNSTNVATATNTTATYTASLALERTTGGYDYTVSYAGTSFSGSTTTVTTSTFDTLAIFGIEGPNAFLTLDNVQVSVSSGSLPLLAPDWRMFLGLPGDGSRDLANPSGDGVPNLVKFALNLASDADGLESPAARTLLDPEGTTVEALTGLPVMWLDHNGRASFTFIRRRDASMLRLTYHVEWSDNLGDWLPNAAATEAVLALDETWERVTVTDSFTRAEKPSRFSRLGIVAD